MVYRILHFYVGQLLRLFIRRLDIQGIENVPTSGPVVLAATHPNSFLDAIIIAVNIKRPAWSLGRGDVFQNPIARYILAQFNMLPIYRMSEGAENLYKNDDTFDIVTELFQKNEQVLIFIEGLCTNQTELLPLKKGTARLMFRAWNVENIPLKIVPMGITYNHFASFGKHVNWHIGEELTQKDFAETKEMATFLKSSNELIASKLNNLLSWNFKEASFFNNPLYYVGWAVNFPLYFLAEAISKRLTKGTVHTDSVTFAIIVFTLPVYWLVIFLIAKYRF